MKEDQPRLLVLDLHPLVVQCGFAGIPATVVTLQPVIGYLKEMSPFLPISHDVQLRGHWIYPELGEIEQKIETKHVEPLAPEASIQALYDYLTEIIHHAMGAEASTYPLFLAIHVPHLASRGDKLAEIAFEALDVPFLALFKGEGEGSNVEHAELNGTYFTGKGKEGQERVMWSALHRWRDSSTIAQHAWARGMFVPRARYMEVGPGCISVLDRDSAVPPGAPHGRNEKS